MPLKGWIDRARKAAREHLPEDVISAGRRLRDRLVGEEDRGPPAARADEPPATSPSEPAEPAAAQREADALARFKQKAEHGLKPEDQLVVVYFTREVDDDVAAIRASLSGLSATVREMDLGREPPQTSRQLAELTGVMVPPYVYINGRYWGGRYEIETLAASGDLEAVVANRLDEIGDEARRIGKIRESFSDEITVENLLGRWKLGHILCVDDLDAWYEVDKDGTERFFYQGAAHSADQMPRIAEEIVRAVDEEEIEAVWQLEPSVHIG
jgi:glutaredoxin